MTKNKHLKALHNRLPMLGITGNFLFVLPVNQVMSGLAVEATPTHIYYWRYLIPLYDKIDFLHFGIAERIWSHSSSESLDMHFSESGISEKCIIAPNGSLDEVISYCETVSSDNDYAQKALGLSHIMKGDWIRAEKELKKLRDTRKLSPGSMTMQGIEELVTLLTTVPGGAKELLHQWITENKRKFRLS
ncbi:MAG TPA: hypothetical protein VGD13_06730 [Xanthobacteraceae bacterium]